MINLKQGAYPTFSVGGEQLPFNDADVGKEYEIAGLVKLDSIRSEGPVFTFEVRKIDFPELDTGTISGRKKKKLSASGVTVIINTGK
jgi:hypothetical protein